jgi:hypothetical protein
MPGVLTQCRGMASMELEEVASAKSKKNLVGLIRLGLD